MLAAYLILLVLTVIWGFTFPLVQSALAYASPMAFVAVRFALATVLLALFVWPRAFRIQRGLLVKGLVLGAFLWGGYAFQTFGLSLTSVARSGFLTGLLVPLTPLSAWLLFRTRISRGQVAAVGLAFLGTAVMSQPGAGGFNLGDALTVVCALCFALHVVFVSRWSARENEVPLTWLQIAATALLAGLTTPFTSPHFVLAPVLLIALAVAAVLATSFAIWAQMRYQPRISPAAAAVIYAMEPVFAGLAAWLILGTVPGPATLLGAALIVAGMLLTAAGPIVTKPEIP